MRLLNKINYVMMQTVYYSCQLNLCKGCTNKTTFHINLLYAYPIEMNVGKLWMTMWPGSIQN